MTDEVGVVVMAYGTPASPAGVEAYYTHIRRGRPPSAEQLANLQMRYDALGGTSTLAARTSDQIAALSTGLAALAPGRFVVALGQKHAPPFIEDGVATLVARGVAKIVGLVLAPHFSAFSVGEYHQRAGEAAATAGVPYRGIDQWHDLPEYRAFLVDAVVDGLADMPPATHVVFTAHSLPERLLADDPYPDQLQESAEAVAADVARARGEPTPRGAEVAAARAADPTGDPIADALAGGVAKIVADAATSGVLAHRLSWSVAWQSAGATPEPWRGPDVLEVIREVAAAGGTDGLLVCPQGFVADHLEVAYDLDIEARRVADEVGLAFARTRVLNADPTVFAALAARVAAAADVRADHG